MRSISTTVLTLPTTRGKPPDSTGAPRVRLRLAAIWTARVVRAARHTARPRVCRRWMAFHKSHRKKARNTPTGPL